MSTTTPTSRAAGAVRAAGAAGAARGLAMMSGGPILLAAVTGAGVGAVVRARARHQRPPLAAVLAILPGVAYVTVVRRWSRSWGSTRVERREELPGDELVPRPGLRMTRAVTIEAPVAAAWPWLVQIGQDRAGFYSYSWLENLAGCGMVNADRVHPEWQDRAVGDVVPLHPSSGVRVARLEVDRCLVFPGWYFNLVPLGADRTRLIARTRVPRGIRSVAYACLVELPHFVMERKMLLGIKARVEASARPVTPAPGPPGGHPGRGSGDRGRTPAPARARGSRPAAGGS
jgi:hypothetical protein